MKIWLSKNSFSSNQQNKKKDSRAQPLPKFSGRMNSLKPISPQLKKCLKKMLNKNNKNLVSIN